VIAFLDSSVILRLVLGEPRPFDALIEMRETVASALCRVEAIRTLDRLERRGSIRPTEAVRRRQSAELLISRCEVVRLDSDTMARAAGNFPVPLRTLDALHLSSADLFRARAAREVAFVTHDEELGRAARALGFSVLGVQ
jgi:predicted nucleic acid-binding protein